MHRLTKLPGYSIVDYEVTILGKKDFNSMVEQEIVEFTYSSTSKGIRLFLKVLTNAMFLIDKF